MQLTKTLKSYNAYRAALGLVVHQQQEIADMSDDSIEQQQSLAHLRPDSKAHCKHYRRKQQATTNFTSIMEQRARSTLFSPNIESHKCGRHTASFITYIHLLDPHVQFFPSDCCRFHIRNDKASRCIPQSSYIKRTHTYCFKGSTNGDFSLAS